MVPHIVIHLVVQIDRYHLSTPRLYEATGSDEQVGELLKQFRNSRCVPTMDELGGVVLSDCLKRFLSELRDPLIPLTSYSEFLRSSKNEDQLIQLIEELPVPNRETLSFLCQHWQRVSECSQVNEMDLAKLASCVGPVVFGANLLPNALSSGEDKTCFDAMRAILALPMNTWVHLATTIILGLGVGETEAMERFAIPLLFVSLLAAAEGLSVAPKRALFTPGDVQVGTSPGFQKAAAHFLSSVNMSVNPCDDFFEFACGKWIANNPIPDDLTGYGHFHALREKNFGYWPIVHGAHWSREDFDLTELLINIGQSRAMDVFIDIYVSPDQKNVTRRMLHVDQGNLGLGSGSREYYLNDTRYGKQMKAYEDYMIAKIRLVVEDAGVNRTLGQIKSDVNEILTFERNLAKTLVPEEDRRNFSKMYNIRKLGDLDTLMPIINWDKYFRSLIPFEMHDYLNSNPDIVINEIDFLEKLTALLQSTDPRVITNYVLWRYTGSWSFQLDERFDNAQQDFLKALLGKKSKSPRWKDCQSAAGSRMAYASGALYVRAHFDKADKDAALAMIDDLHGAFRELVLTNNWMEDKTRDIALEKAKEMQSLIGFPDFIYNDTALDEYYAKLHLEADDSYPQLVQKASKWAQERAFERLLEPVDRAEFGISSAVVNAFYSSLKNGITFPAAILQAPFFDRDFPRAVNYAGIGAVIGHEITHGFDDQGSQFDKIGNLHNWWDPETQKRFMDRTNCIVQQYSEYEVPGTELKINGKLTQGENIADNGGIKEAYKAYRRFLDKLGHEEKRLPGLEQYSNEQIFFMSYAQTWCGHTKPEALIRQILTDPHAPLRFRVNGVVINQPEFAHAFNCPAGSKMNPSQRCVVW
ncbi:hypothetical protein QR680_001367 [Steinernema hermaphroditum]|uniref:Rho-GAP domain-containing protein n=1 Tax=Steinernema hermaphroditum TaxID=289476 RepID=A0AA39GXY3_9BILA|nr:hypothetical protein QR680_001367 [Steinernema hermaphroditum]